MINYILQINLAYEKIKEESLTTNAQCLYFYILHENNLRKWAERFHLPNMVISGYTKLNKQQLIRARKELIEKGFVLYHGAETYTCIEFQDTVIPKCNRDDTEMIPSVIPKCNRKNAGTLRIQRFQDRL